MDRHALPLLTELLTLFPCVALIGVRQCGKTTMLEQLPANWRRFDLERGDHRTLIESDPDLFLRLNPKQVAIDECQLAPSLFPALRVAIDADRDTPGRFVITGSSSPSLLSAISESLAGRVAIVEMAPLSVAEAHDLAPSNFASLIASKAPADALLELRPRVAIDRLFDHWHRGGYPEPWLKGSERFHRLWMQNYIATYVDRDILQLFPGLNRQKYRLFVQMLAQLSGTIINYAQVARALSVSQPTAREYFQIAHGTFVWRHLPAYDKNTAKRVVKHPKGYVRDSGLLHYLLHLNSLDELMTHPQRGHSFEALAVETLLRSLDVLGAGYQACHYRTGGGAEIDLVLEGEFGLLPVEVKFGQRLVMRELRGIRDFMAERDCRIGLVLHNGERVERIDERLVAVPLACL